MNNGQKFARAADIEASLELLAEHCEDPTQPIYERMFAVHPYMKPYFWRDTNHAIKGEMLSRTFAAILDFVGPRLYADHMIKTEMVTHEGYEVPREVFITFFEIIRDTMREQLGDVWTAQIDEAWELLLADIRQYTDLTPRIDLDNIHSRALRARLEAGGMKFS